MADKRQPKNDRLATALQLAGLGIEQQQGADRAQQARVAQAIQLLGLMNEQEQAQLRTRQLGDSLGIQRDELTQRRAEAEQRVPLAILNYLQGQPGAGEAGLDYAGVVDPRFAQIRQAGQHSAQQAQLERLGLNPDGTPKVAVDKPKTNPILENYMKFHPIMQGVEDAKSLGTTLGGWSSAEPPQPSPSTMSAKPPTTTPPSRSPVGALFHEANPFSVGAYGQPQFDVNRFLQWLTTGQ